MTALKCPSCGGRLQFSGTDGSGCCPYCGTQCSAPENPAREPTPEELRRKLDDAKARVDSLMATVMPGHRRVMTSIIVIAAIIFIFALGFILLVFTKLATH